MAIHEDGWLTVAEACRYLKITRATLYRWARAGRLPMYKLGQRGTRLRQADLNALLSEKSSAAYVTVVGPAKWERFAIAGDIQTVEDALKKLGQAPENSIVFLNQERRTDLRTPLSVGDLLVIMPKAFEKELAGAHDLSEQAAWLKLAESSFSRDWDNPKDAIYDNWKELYGVRDR